MKVISAILAALVLAVALIAGCSKNDTTSQKTNKDTKKERIEVGLVSPAMTSVFHVTLVEGAKEQSTAEGFKLRSMAPARESNFNEQVGMIENLVQSKVKAISICAINDKAVVGAVKKANAAGIPIFIHNSLTELPGGEVAAYIGYDQREGGRKCGEKAIELLRKKYGTPKGKVAILDGVDGFHTRERAGGFKEALAAYPEIKIVAEQAADWERGKGVTITENMLQRDGSIDLVFGCSDAMAQGAAQAARHAGKSIFTIGIDGNPDAVADVGKGNLTATLAVYPKEMGQTIIKSMKDSLEGKKVEKFIKTPSIIVDKSNWEEFK